MTFTDALKDGTRSYGGPPAPVSPDPPSPTPYDVERQLIDELSTATDRRPIYERLARHYDKHRLQADAFRCLKWLLANAADAELEASYEHQMGLLHESFGDFPAAAAHYRRGLSLEPANLATAYWLANLLAYCLQATGKFVEAEFYARQAIQVLPIMPNAYKNLGLALKGQGRFKEAAEAFIQATKADPSDGRALCLLDNLLAAHPEMLPEFQADLKHCWGMVVIRRQAEAELRRRGELL
jgi:tetratricopeptide (TPR) repeat protein